MAEAPGRHQEPVVESTAEAGLRGDAGAPPVSWQRTLVRRIALLVAAPPVTVALASGGAESGAAGTPLEAYRPVAGLLWGAAGVIGLIFAIGSLPQWRSRS